MKDYQGYANNIKTSQSLKEIWDCVIWRVLHILFVHWLCSLDKMRTRIQVECCQKWDCDDVEDTDWVKLNWESFIVPLLGETLLRSVVCRIFYRALLPCGFGSYELKPFFFFLSYLSILPSFLSQNWLVGCYAIVTKMMMIEERPKFMNEIMSLEKRIALSTSRPRTSSDSRTKSQGKSMSAEFACGLFIPSLLDALGSLRLHALRLCLHYTG